MEAWTHFCIREHHRLMVQMRPIVDYATRKAINLKQIKEDDFQICNHRYVLNWNKSPDYTHMYLKAILEHKEDIFLYIQGYYRAVMKNKDISEYPVFRLD
jgi:CRISPR-associated protein Cas1